MFTDNQCLEELTPRIQNAAKRVFAGQPVKMVEMDDIAQQMALRVLERAKQVPGFTDQKPAYIMIDIVRNAGYRLCEKEYTYSKYVSPDIKINQDGESGFGDEMLIMDCARSLEPDPERTAAHDEIIDELVRRIKELTPHCRQVIALAMQGYNDSEIARILGVTRMAISDRRITIRKHLQTIREELATEE